MRLRNVRYRQATFDVMAKGAGVGGQVLLDGSPVTLIPADIEGQHTIELRTELIKALSEENKLV